MGGQVPLGYRVEARKLVVEESESEVVRTIFRRYQELGSLGRLIQDLDARGIMTKQRRLANGSVRGGIAFTRGPLAYLLSNRTYLGEIAYRGARHEGEHAAIVDRDLFDAVQEQLKTQSRACRSKLRAQSSPLTGRIFDDRGNRMTPSHARKNGARYRYYVSCPVLQGRRQQAGSVARVPAPEIEAAVLDTMTKERAGAIIGHRGARKRHHHLRLPRASCGATRTTRDLLQERTRYAGARCALAANDSHAQACGHCPARPAAMGQADPG
jgi:site-specific DNA recombinase